MRRSLACPRVTGPFVGGGFGLWIRFVGCFGASVAYSLPRYFVERGRVTLLGKAAYVLATGAAVLALVLLTPWIVELAGAR